MQYNHLWHWIDDWPWDQSSCVECTSEWEEEDVSVPVLYKCVSAVNNVCSEKGLWLRNSLPKKIRIVVATCPLHLSYIFSLFPSFSFNLFVFAWNCCGTKSSLLFLHLMKHMHTLFLIGCCLFPVCSESLVYILPFTNTLLPSLPRLSPLPWRLQAVAKRGGGFGVE